MTVGRKKISSLEISFTIPLYMTVHAYSVAVHATLSFSFCLILCHLLSIAFHYNYLYI